MKNNSRGFTLIEIIGAMIIVSILTIAGSTTASKAIHRSRVDATTADLQIFASDMEAILEDVGVLDLDPADSMDYRRSKIQEYLALIEQDYTHATFDRATLVPNNNGFTIDTFELMDPWNSHYRLIYNTNAGKGVPGTCILASPGPNMVFETIGYGDGEFKDDILVIITPKS